MNPLLPGQKSGVQGVSLKNRPVYVDPATGERRTVYSMGFNEGPDGKGEGVLVPTVVNGRQLTDDEAIEYYRKTGQNLGKFVPGKVGLAANDRMGYLVHKQQETDPLVTALLRAFRF
jgi:hypothetical protein